MSKKRMFEILDDMNVHDALHGTQFVTLHPDIVQMQHMKKGKGTRVTMGVCDGIIKIADQLSDRPKKRIVLMIVDGNEYDKRSK